VRKKDTQQRLDLRKEGRGRKGGKGQERERERGGRSQQGRKTRMENCKDEERQEENELVTSLGGG
jgi:hypothetical protein